MFYLLSDSYKHLKIVNYEPIVVIGIPRQEQH